MAVVKTINKDKHKQTSNRMYSDAQAFGALNYITRKDKTTPALTYYNLSNSNFTNYETIKFFQQTRKMYDKDNKILAHHLVQSFDVNDKLTPELANKIGRELIHKCFPDMQVVMTTHTDGKCLHNHFIINSVSPIDGHKFLDNMKTVRMIRRVSDELCYKYGLTVIENPQNDTSRLDDATFRKAVEGKSWKFNLVNDIDKALEKCKTKRRVYKLLLKTMIIKSNMKMYILYFKKTVRLNQSEQIRLLNNLEINIAKQVSTKHWDCNL